MQTLVNRGLARRIIIWTAGIIVVVALCLVMARIPRTLAIFTIAGFIAFGVYPITSRLERYMNRALAIAIVYVALLIASVVVVLLIVPATFVELQSLLINAPDYLTDFNRGLEHYSELVRARFGKTPFSIDVSSIQEYIGTKTVALLTSSFTSIGSILVDTLTGLFIVISAIILSFFFLTQGEDVTDAVLSLVPLRRRRPARALLIEIVHIFGSFVSGQVIVCTITGVIIWIVCAAIGFKFALLVAVVSGLLYAIPFVGMLVAQVIGAVLAIPQGAGMVIWVSVVIFVVARVSDNIIVPKIFSSSVGVSPIGVMFAVFAGGELFGMPGLVLGIPAAALIKVVLKYALGPAVDRMHAAEEAREAEKARREAGQAAAGVPIVEVEATRESGSGDVTVVVNVEPSTLSG